MKSKKPVTRKSEPQWHLEEENENSVLGSHFAYAVAAIATGNVEEFVKPKIPQKVPEFLEPRANPAMYQGHVTAAYDEHTKETSRYWTSKHVPLDRSPRKYQIQYLPEHDVGPKHPVEYPHIFEQSSINYERHGTVQPFMKVMKASRRPHSVDPKKIRHDRILGPYSYNIPDPWLDGKRDYCGMPQESSAFRSTSSRFSVAGPEASTTTTTINGSNNNHLHNHHNHHNSSSFVSSTSILAVDHSADHLGEDVELLAATSYISTALPAAARYYSAGQNPSHIRPMTSSRIQRSFYQQMHLVHLAKMTTKQSRRYLQQQQQIHQQQNNNNINIEHHQEQQHQHHQSTSWSNGPQVKLDSQSNIMYWSSEQQAGDSGGIQSDNEDEDQHQSPTKNNLNFFALSSLPINPILGKCDTHIRPKTAEKHPSQSQAQQQQHQLLLQPRPSTASGCLPGASTSTSVLILPEIVPPPLSASPPPPILAESMSASIVLARSSRSPSPMIGQRALSPSLLAQLYPDHCPAATDPLSLSQPLPSATAMALQILHTRKPGFSFRNTKEATSNPLILPSANQQLDRVYIREKDEETGAYVIKAVTIEEKLKKQEEEQLQYLIPEHFPVEVRRQPLPSARLQSLQQRQQRGDHQQQLQQQQYSAVRPKTAAALEASTSSLLYSSLELIKTTHNNNTNNNSHHANKKERSKSGHSNQYQRKYDANYRLDMIPIGDTHYSASPKKPSSSASNGGGGKDGNKDAANFDDSIGGGDESVWSRDDDQHEGQHLSSRQQQQDQEGKQLQAARQIKSDSESTVNLSSPRGGNSARLAAAVAGGAESGKKSKMKTQQKLLRQLQTRSKYQQQGQANNVTTSDKLQSSSSQALLSPPPLLPSEMTASDNNRKDALQQQKNSSAGNNSTYHKVVISRWNPPMCYSKKNFMNKFPLGIIADTSNNNNPAANSKYLDTNFPVSLPVALASSLDQSSHLHYANNNYGMYYGDGIAYNNSHANLHSAPTSNTGGMVGYIGGGGGGGIGVNNGGKTFQEIDRMLMSRRPKTSG